MQSQVSVGPTTVVGWFTFVVSALTTLCLALSEHSAELSGPGKWSAILAITAFVLTNAGRYLQAHAMFLTRRAINFPLSPPTAIGQAGQDPHAGS